MRSIAARYDAAYHQTVTLKLNECPVDLQKVAEAYFLRTLPEDQAIAFEHHYATCDACATLLYKIADSRRHEPSCPQT